MLLPGSKTGNRIITEHFFTAQVILNEQLFFN